MSEYVKIFLNAGKEQSPKRFHPWVFSGAIKRVEGEVASGDLVEVYSSQREYLGAGHYQEGSIAVRLLTFIKEKIDQDFWNKSIKKAFDHRTILGLTDNPHTNVYRLIHGEGDNLPGLIIDIYDNCAVMQCHTPGMHAAKEMICEALKLVYDGKLNTVYDKSAETLPKHFALQTNNQFLLGNQESVTVIENDNKFHVDWINGQKTGFFIDQRDNRDLLAGYCKGKKVLNTFCYTGGFSIYALKAGALEVHSVDVSKKAIELTNKNVILNGFTENHEAFAEDTFDFLDKRSDYYEVIVLDPPAFAKHRDVKHNAVMGYKRLNAEAIKRIKKGGILFTFSCSQVVDTNLFTSTVMAASIIAGRRVKVLHKLGQPSDHAFSIYHPEGEYLKGLVLLVD